MLYVLRLTGGDCIVLTASDENHAREQAANFALEGGESIVSVRPLPDFAVRLSPNEDGSLDVNGWNDATLDDILEHEYPLLNRAFRTANTVRFMPVPDPDKPLMIQLREAHEQNAEIIREGLREEQSRLTSTEKKHTAGR